MKKIPRGKKALSLGQAALEELIEEITVDAYGEDEQLWAFPFPAPGPRGSWLLTGSGWE